VPGPQLLQLSVWLRPGLLEPPSAQSPFARTGCYHGPGRPHGSPQRELPLFLRSYGLMRQTITLPAPRWSLGRRVFAGCHQSLLGDGPSRHYLCNPCVGAWTHTPPCLPGALAHFLPWKHRPHATGNAFGTRNHPCKAVSAGSVFSGLQSFDYLQAPTLARPPGCSHRNGSKSVGRPGRLHHASPRRLPALRCGIATCPTWATDMVGLPPTGLQPCRLLLPALRAPAHFSSRVMRPSGWSDFWR
jgi:hypothetical protein